MPPFLRVKRKSSCLHAIAEGEPVLLVAHQGHVSQMGEHQLREEERPGPHTCLCGGLLALLGFILALRKQESDTESQPRNPGADAMQKRLASPPPATPGWVSSTIRQQPCCRVGQVGPMKGK